MPNAHRFKKGDKVLVDTGLQNYIYPNGHSNYKIWDEERQRWMYANRKSFEGKICVVVRRERSAYQISEDLVGMSIKNPSVNFFDEAELLPATNELLFWNEVKLDGIARHNQIN